MISSETVRVRSFIIVEPDPIVSMDVQGILRSAFPRAMITTFRSAAMCSAELHAANAGITILFDAGLLTNSMIPTLCAAVQRGAQVVVIGGNVELDFQTAFVDSPFTSQMILDAFA